MSRPRIHRRFLWPFIAAMLTGTLLAWVLGNLMYSATLEQRLTDQLQHAAGVLADGAFPLTPGLLTRLARLLRADIALLGTDGAVALTTAPGRPDLAPMIAQGLVAASAPDAPSSTRLAEAGFVGVIQALPEGRDTRYRAIALLADLSDVRQASRESAFWLGLAALFGVLILTWILHRIGLSITQPVEALSRMADAIARGDRQVRVRVERADEIGDLAASLNAMAERLDRYEREMIKQDRLAALGNMAARIAHEVRNPLTAVKLNIQLLAEDLPEDRQAAVAGLEAEMDRLELIVSGVLSQAQPGPPTLSRRPTEPGRLIEETVRLFQPQFRHRGIDLETRLEGTTPLVWLDPDRFKQALMNLLVNARDALPDGGQVLVTCGHDRIGEQVVILVEDNGPGIAPDQQAGALAGGDSDKPQGLGLGLRLSRELVQAHGGTLGLGCSRLGGLRAEIRLPSGTEAA